MTWKTETDRLEGIIEMLDAQSVDPDEAFLASDKVRQLERKLWRIRKSIDTMLRTEMSDVYRMLTPHMNIETFAVLVDERAVKVFPSKVREIADRYGWEIDNND